MEIKRSFLNSLEGLFQDQAQALVEAEGLTYKGLIMGHHAIADMILPDTVICWLNDEGTVDVVVAGDPGQVVEDA